MSKVKRLRYTVEVDYDPETDDETIKDIGEYWLDKWYEWPKVRHLRSVHTEIELKDDEYGDD